MRIRSNWPGLALAGPLLVALASGCFLPFAATAEAEAAAGTVRASSTKEVSPPKPIAKPRSKALRAAFDSYRADRRLVGQLLFMGFQGKSLDSQFVQEFARQIELGHVGGVLFLRHNMPRSKAELTSLVGAFKASRRKTAQKLPLLLGVDQEGGRVERLRPWHGVDSLPTPQVVGASSSKEITATYRGLACQIEAAGFNVNFGPVLDVDVNANNPIIGRLGRSFSNQPAEVVRAARAFLAGHADCGVGTVGKHFPGHGSASVDSHKGLPDITRAWRPAEMEPFKALANDAALRAIMVGHLFHNLVDSKEPSSLSKAWIKGYLRERLGFTGLIITDDLDMRAITTENSSAQAALKALAAGADMAMVAGGVAPYPGLAQQIIEEILDELNRPYPRLTRQDLVNANQRVRRYAETLR